MENNDLATYLFVGFLTVLAAVILIPEDFFPYSRLFILVIVGASCISFGLVTKQPKPKTKTIPYADVTLHYPFPVTNDTYNIHIPELITNNTTRHAYRLSSKVLRTCVKEKGIDSIYSHRNSKTLRSTLLNWGFEIHEEEATFDDIDMIPKRDGTVMVVPNPVKEKMAKLKEQKDAGAFKDLELVFVHSVQFLTDKRKTADFPTARRLLVDRSNRTARQPPYGDLWMWKEGLFEEKERRKWLPCPLFLWCFFYDARRFFPRPIKYQRKKQYTIAELLGKPAPTQVSEGSVNLSA